MTGEIVLTERGPSSAVASAWILLSASSTPSSPASRKRMVAMATWVPSVSVSGHRVQGCINPGLLAGGVDLRLVDGLESLNLQRPPNQK